MQLAAATVATQTRKPRTARKGSKGLNTCPLARSAAGFFGSTTSYVAAYATTVAPPEIRCTHNRRRRRVILTRKTATHALRRRRQSQHPRSRSTKIIYRFSSMVFFYRKYLHARSRFTTQLLYYNIKIYYANTHYVFGSSLYTAVDEIPYSWENIWALVSRLYRFCGDCKLRPNTFLSYKLDPSFIRLRKCIRNLPQSLKPNSLSMLRWLINVVLPYNYYYYCELLSITEQWFLFNYWINYLNKWFDQLYF